MFFFLRQWMYIFLQVVFKFDYTKFNHHTMRKLIRSWLNYYSSQPKQGLALIVGSFIGSCHLICTYRTPYHTPLYDRDLRDAPFIGSSWFTIKALSLRSWSAPFDPGIRQFLGGQLHARACTTTWHNTWRSLASEPEINLGGPICMWRSKRLCVYHLSETWFWPYVTFKTHLFASLDMPISKDF